MFPQPAAATPRRSTLPQRAAEAMAMATAVAAAVAAAEAAAVGISIQTLRKGHGVRPPFISLTSQFLTFSDSRLAVQI